MKTPSAAPSMLDLQLFQAIPGNNIVLLPDVPRYTIVAATDDYVRTSGKSRQALLGRGLFEVFSKTPDETGEESEQIIRASLTHVLAKKELHRLPVYRYDITTAEGLFEERHWSVVNKPVLNQNGEVVYIIHAAEDLTQQVKAKEREAAHQELQKAYREIEKSQQELRQAHQQIADILESTTDAFYALDSGFNFTYINKRAAQLWGRDRDSLIGRHYWTEFKKAVGSKSYQMHHRVMAERKPVHYETVSPLLGIWIEANIYPGASGGLSVFFRDITERKAAEEKLRDSESKYRRLFQSIDQGFCLVELIYDEEGKAVDHLFLETNSTYEAQTGLKDVVGKTARQLAPGIEPFWFDKFDNVLRSGEPIRFTHQSVSLDRWFDVYVYPAGEMDSRSVAVLFTDITQKRREEEALQRSEERLKKVLSIETVGVIYFDLDGTIHGANAAFERISGYAQEDFTSGRVRWDVITPPEFMAVTLRSREELLTMGQNTPYEKQYIRPDGSRFWGLFAGKRLSGSECVEFVLDITEQKQATGLLEQRVAERTRELAEQKSLLDNILLNSSNGISVTEMVRGENGEVIDAWTILANDAAVKFTGLPKDIYFSKKATELDPEILQSPYGKMCLHTLETGEPSVSQYFLEMTGRWLELTISKMDKDHLIHIFTDVTPIKEAQLKQERSVEELKHTNQNLEEFAYAASHDMKEPLRKIHFFADRLKGELGGQLTEGQRHLFERMENAAQRMTLLVDDLLTYSHVSRGVAQFEPIDLNRKVQLVLDDLEVAIEEKKAVVTVEKLPTVMGHRRQIQQLFQNLIGNALKYSRPGVSPQVRIRSHEAKGAEIPLPLPGQAASRRYHSIEVSDNGIGFPQEDANRIFQVFTRLHGNNEYRGTGVGLSIAQKVVQNHGGYIWAESRPDEGATFYVLLPVD